MLLAIFALASTAQPLQPFCFDNQNESGTGPVYQVAQDGRGLHWLATSKGLYTFDGYRFTPQTDPTTAQLLYILSLQPDNVHILLGGANGLYCYNRQTGQNRKVPGRKISELRAIVNVPTMSGRPQILAGGHEGLFLYEAGRLRHLSKVPKDIFCFYNSASGVYIGTLHGLYLYAQGRCTRLTLKGLAPRDGAEAISSIKPDEATGKLWLGTFRGLYAFDPYSKAATVTALGDVVVKNIESYSGGLLVSTDDGLYTYSSVGLVHYVHDSRMASSIGNDVVWSALYDKDHNIIIGTDLGLSVVPGNSFCSVVSLFSLTGLSSGNNIEHIYMDSMHTLWMGGSGGLIHNETGGRLMATGKPSTWFRFENSLHPLPYNHVRCIKEDSKHRLWVSTDMGIGLYTHGRIIPKMIVDPTTGINVPWIYDIAEDSKGRLWMTGFGEAVYVVDANQLENCKYYCKALKKINCGSNVRTGWQLVYDGKLMWVRTDYGVTTVNPESGKSKTVFKGKTFYLVSDACHHIWTATKNGLMEYGTQGNLLKTVGFDENLQQSAIVGLMVIADEIWIVTPTTCAIYSQRGWRAAMRIPGVRANCCYYDRQHQRVYIGGNNGIVSFPKNRCNNTSIRQQLLLSQLWVNEHPLAVKDKSLMSLTEIRLDHDNNNLKLLLSDLPLKQQAAGIYSYQLSGFDNQWHYLPDLSEAIVYNGLPHGKYTLRVNRLNGFDGTGTEVFRLNIDIAAPWYLTWWAKMLYILAAIAVAAGTINLYVVRRRIKEERTARRHVMEESEKQMSFYNTLSAHLYTGLSRVMRGIAQLSEKEGKGELALIGQQTTLLNANVRQALDMGQQDNQAADCPAVTINIGYYSRNVLESLRNEATARGVRLAISKLEDSLRYPVNIIEWDTAVYILMRSAIFYSERGAVVTLSIIHDQENKRVSLSLTSSKFGVDDDALPHFFQRYSKWNDSQEQLPQDMFRVKEYADKCSGQETIQRNSNGSVTLRLFLPMTEETEDGRTEQTEQLKTQADPADEKLMQDITKAIEDHISDLDFNVTKLQETVGIGRKLLYRRTKQSTGMSPVEFIRFVRMKQAALLLSQGKFPVSSVMYMVGFSNSGYFSKCFQKEFGVTPTQYKRGS